MPIDLSRCTACRTACHPPRALCPVCGADAWTPEPCPAGTVEECTTVTGARPPVVLASIRTPAGPVVIAALSAPAAPGTPVALRPGPGHAVLAQPIAPAERTPLVSPP